MVEISYVEITVTDIAVAQRFYGEVFGWEFTDYGPSYSGIRRANGSGEMGGFALADEVPAGGPLVLMESSDLEFLAAAVTRAGGEAGPITGYPGGRRFEFSDPSGNRLGVFASDPTG